MEDIQEDVLGEFVGVGFQGYRFVVEEADGCIVRKVRIEPSGL